MILDDSDDDPTSMLRSRVIASDNGHDLKKKKTMATMATMQMTR